MTVTQTPALAGGPAATIIRDAGSRRTQVPSGLVTTLASPAQGGSGLAVWRMDITPGTAGPVHAYDTEQVWTVIAGQAGATRQMIADAQAGVSAISVTPAGTHAYTPAGPIQVDPHCAIPAGGDKLTPAWVV
jgi:hypothetical protein